VIIVRNMNSDSEQLEFRFKNKIKKINEYLLKLNIKKKFNINIIKCGDFEKITASDDDLVICLANQSQTDKLYKIISKYPYRYEVYIDEIDAILYSDSSTAENIELIKEKSFKNTGITATPLDSIFAETGLKSKNIIRLPVSQNYHGLDRVKVNLLTNPIHSVNLISTYEEIIEKDKNIKPFLEMFKILKNKNIPNICLMKFSRIIENQENVYDGIVKNYKKDFTVLLQNGRGIKIYHHTLKNFIINGKKININKYVNLQINETLQFLFDNGGINVFPRIIIISGDMAGRSVSYVSSNFIWHLTDMYYVPSKSTPANELEQNISRLTGVYTGDARLVLHATQEVVNTTWKAHSVIKEVITRGINTPLFKNGKEECFAYTFKSIKIEKSKIPTGRNLVSRVAVSTKEMFSRVNGSDGGWDKKEYEYSVAKIEKIEQVEDSINTIVDGVDINKIKKWIKDKLIVGKIIMFLSNQTQPVSVEEVKDGIEYTSSISQFKNNICNGSGIRTKYGKVWCVVGGKISINKNIIKYINLNGNKI
ncbi:MAG: hypothetical protein WCH21_10625, partial [Bacteroidota bacterium]